MHIRKFYGVAAGALLLSIAGLTSPCFAYGPQVSIGIDVAIPLPPGIVYAGPPALVVVPGTNVYVAPDVEGDLVFYGGAWWRPYQGHWFRSPSYRGPWQHIIAERVPPAVYGLPPGYRYAYREHHRIMHEDVMRNWERWDHDHYWERHDPRDGYDRRHEEHWHDR